MNKSLRFAALSVLTLVYTANAQFSLTNRDHTLKPVEVPSHTLSLSTGIAAGVGLTYCVGNPLERWICRKVGMELDGATPARYALWLAKVMAVGTATAYAYGYTHTFANESIWAPNAVRALQAELNDYALICMIYDTLAATFAADAQSLARIDDLKKLKELYAVQLQAHIAQCSIWKYQVCDDATLACVQAIEQDWENLAHAQGFDAVTRDYLIHLYTDDAQRLELLCAACDLVQRNQEKDAQFLTTAALADLFVFGYNYWQEELALNAARNKKLFEIASRQAARVAYVRTGYEIVSAAYEYGTERVGQWWAAQE